VWCTGLQQCQRCYPSPVTHTLPLVHRADRSVLNIKPLQLDDDNAISKFVRAVRGGLVVSEGEALVLPDGMVWPGTNSSKLFVRACYAPLFDSVLKQCKLVETDDESDLRFVVTGQPGIGKSMWGCVPD